MKTQRRTKKSHRDKSSERQWLRPPRPIDLKIKTAQWLRIEEEASKPFAVRYIFEEPHNSPITTTGKIVPIPEFGAIAYNFELYHGIVVFHWNLKNTVDRDGIQARFRAEVWKIQNNQPKLLIEEWFASELPNNRSFSEFIARQLEIWRKQETNQFAKTAPERAISSKRPSRTDEERSVDHNQNAKEVCERLLRREYPQTYRAIDINANDGEIRKAFIVDNIANTGTAPEAEELEKFFHDKEFFNQLFKAAKRKGHKVPGEEWTLATGWVKAGFYRMSDIELEIALNKKTGLNLKGNSWRRKAQRLGLISARKLGRPEKKNILPASI